jgi:hypothetical protein
MLQPSPANTQLSLNLIEAGLTLIAVTASFAWPGLGSSLFTRVERTFGRLARRPVLSIVSVGLSVIVLRLALLPICPIPLPFVPDDFSFLLAADTFLHGRLANPTPAMWIPFESIHIDMRPTYGSMYFPAQGLLLAAGKLAFGNPWFGVLVSSALMCAALCWMLRAWLPPQWALLGGFIAVLRLGVFSYWTNTYHAAGSIAALGGAMVLGSLPRLKRRPGVGLGLVMASGMALLAGTRPYEGMLLCIVVLVSLVRWFLHAKDRPPAATLALRAAPALVVLIAAGAWLGYYDYRAFGSPTTLPYSINRATYAIAPYYVWQPPRPEPAYHHAMMRYFYHHNELDAFNKIHSLTGFVPQTFIKAVRAVLFFAGIALIPPLFMLRRALRDRRIRLLSISLGVLAGGLLIENFMLSHYLAPFTAAIYALGLQCMRHLWVWRTGSGAPVGRAMMRFSVAVCVLLAVIRPFDRLLNFPVPESPPTEWNGSWVGPDHFGEERAATEHKLELIPGNQLVLVRYAAGHDPLDEWVYNDADIDGSKVVWAREMDAVDNRKLIAYYRNRRAWLVEPDANPVRISPYPVPEQASPASADRAAEANPEARSSEHD